MKNKRLIDRGVEPYQVHGSLIAKKTDHGLGVGLAERLNEHHRKDRVADPERIDHKEAFQFFPNTFFTSANTSRASISSMGLNIASLLSSLGPHRRGSEPVVFFAYKATAGVPLIHAIWTGPLSTEIKDRKSTRLNSSHSAKSRMPSSA